MSSSRSGWQRHLQRRSEILGLGFGLGGWETEADTVRIEEKTEMQIIESR